MNFKNLMGVKTVRRSSLNKVRDSRRISDTFGEIKKKDVNLFKYVINASGLQNYDSIRDWYSAGVYGWNADVWGLDWKVAIVAGCRPFGDIKAPYDLVDEYSKKADGKGYEEKHALLREFAQRVLEAKGITDVFGKNKSVSDSRRVKDSLDEDEYEEYLNELGEGLDEDEFIMGGESRLGMPYGTAMRQYDPIAFNVGYDEWVRENEDDDDEYKLEQIADLLEEGYRSGYDPQWDLDVTVDGQDISEFNDDDKDLIYQDIAYVVKDGYDNYQGIETELSDGSIVYVDFTLNY